jgi:hypothetical protein
MHAQPVQDFRPVSLSLLSSNSYRLGPILRSLFAEATAISKWNLLWLVTLAALLCIAVRYRGRDAWLIAVCIVLPIALYSCTYFFSAWPDYDQHIISSLPRLLLDVAPLTMLAIALALAPAEARSNEITP